MRSRHETQSIIHTCAVSSAGPPPHAPPPRPKPGLWYGKNNTFKHMILCPIKTKLFNLIILFVFCSQGVCFCVFIYFYEFV